MTRRTQETIRGQRASGKLLMEAFNPQSLTELWSPVLHVIAHVQRQEQQHS